MECVRHRRFIPSLLWLTTSFFWMATAAILGVVMCLSVVDSPFGDWVGGFLPFGRCFMAWKGVFIYGWAVNLLLGLSISMFPSTRRFSQGWHGFFWLVWQVGVVVGFISVLCGEGSGIPAVPFPRWVWMMAAPGFLGVILIIAGTGYRAKDKLSGYALVATVSALTSIFLGLSLFAFVGGAGAVGMLLPPFIVNVFGLGAVVICFSAQLKFSFGSNLMARKLGLLLLIVASVFFIPFAGFTRVASWPVPWVFPELGLTSFFTAFCLLWFVCAICVYCVMTRPRSGSLARRKAILSSIGLLVVAVWLISYFVNPLTSYGMTEMQFSVLRWFGLDVFLLVVTGTVGMSVYAGRRIELFGWNAYFWAFACFLPLLLCGIAFWEYDSIRWQSFEQMPSSISGLVRNILSVKILSNILLLVASLILFRYFGLMLKRGFYMKEGSGTRFSWPLPVVLFVVILIICGTAVKESPHLNEGSRRVIPVKSERPGISVEGSRIYSEEGCSICHTQLIRRLFNGQDLQKIINLGGQGKTVYRVSEPQDYDARMKEGAAHAGYSRIGPDLFNLAARLEHKFENLPAGGQVSGMRSPREWLMMHLYNPQSPKFGNPWSICPPMKRLFVEKERVGGVRDTLALPVDSSGDYDVVPTERAVQLVDYLMTLKRATPILSEDEDDEYYRKDWSHLDPYYIKHPPLIDYSRLKLKERGEQERDAELKTD